MAPPAPLRIGPARTPPALVSKIARTGARQLTFGGGWRAMAIMSCRTLIASLGLLLGLCTPAYAQVDYPVPMGTPDEVQWDATEVTKLVIKTCTIDSEYIRIQRDLDGNARIMQSPSVTPEQRKCAKDVIAT